MMMAANVQANLFPKEAPKTEEWDIAFVFKPMSGVSGDLYDFYEDNGSLKGIAIFDVSGHGVASGLITMIAKSVFRRNITEHPGEKLNRILEMSNSELINEIGKVDNYLTGMIILFKEE
jgi:sigma-B regulation protein RsbU (phosphoserine phosphatase)